MPPLFSIITPAYQAAHLLPHAIESVAAQEDVDWEHIVVDGGSTDGTPDLLATYPKLRWVSEPDRGVYDAMNKGIAMAEGEWLYFLGADDRFLTPTVLKQVAGFIRTCPNTRVLYGIVMSERFGGAYGKEFSRKDILTDNICHQAMFLNRDVFNRIGGFDLRYRIYADWVHNWKWFFDPEIPHQFMDLAIAEYADGGLSSTDYDDPDFFMLQDQMRLRHDRESLDRLKIQIVCMNSAKQAFRDHRYLSGMRYLADGLRQRLLLRLKK